MGPLKWRQSWLKHGKRSLIALVSACVITFSSQPAPAKESITWMLSDYPPIGIASERIDYKIDYPWMAEYLADELILSVK